MDVSFGRWDRFFRGRLLITDALVVLWAVFGSQLLWMGSMPGNLAITGKLSWASVDYVWGSLFIAVAWLVLLSVFQTRDQRVLGSGFSEYRRVASASFSLFGGLAIAAHLLKIELGRGGSAARLGDI